jgi:hypothetical protein
MSSNRAAIHLDSEALGRLRKRRNQVIYAGKPSQCHRPSSKPETSHEVLLPSSHLLMLINNKLNRKTELLNALVEIIDERIKWISPDIWAGVTQALSRCYAGPLIYGTLQYYMKGPSDRCRQCIGPRSIPSMVQPWRVIAWYAYSPHYNGIKWRSFCTWTIALFYFQGRNSDLDQRWIVYRVKEGFSERKPEDYWLIFQKLQVNTLSSQSIQV